jgi:DinB family protein
MIPVSLARGALCALVVLAPAARLAAQASMPPQSIMLVDWERQKKNVLAYIDAMPDSAVTFGPTPGVRNFAQQIEHFVGTNTEIAAVVLRGLKAPPALGDTAEYLHRKPALREYTTKSYDYLLESLRTATPTQLSKSFTLYNQPAAPAWRWLDLSKEHAVWTFGQLIPYLRLNKVTPPAYDMPF